MAARSRADYASVAECGPIPAIIDRKRRERCRLSLLNFLLTYFPLTAGKKPYSDDHRRFIAKLQDAILNGGREVTAVYRGFTKTTIGEISVIWALLYGHKKFCVLLGADKDAAKANLDSIKTELEGNDLLYDDFPEVCHPIRALDGKAQRCRSQKVNGERTHLVWTEDRFALPTVRVDDPSDGRRRARPARTPTLSPASGGCARTKGLLYCNRGMKHKLPDGSQIRPDYVFIDDAQTDLSAASRKQCQSRIRKLYSTVTRLADHDVQLSIYIAGTVIERDDFMDELLDRRRHATWRGSRIPMVRSWSDAHESFWLDAYAKVLTNFDPDDDADRERAKASATRLYKRNRKIADAGCVVSWDHCYNPGELSAIQHAYNILISDGPESFAAECQQQPVRLDALRKVVRPTASQLAARQLGETRGIVPAWADCLVAGIDCQQDVLYWLVAAWQYESFTGQVVDWGTFPDQSRQYFTLGQINHTLRDRFRGADTEGAVYNGLLGLLRHLHETRWPRADGSEHSLDLACVDSGAWASAVYGACRDSQMGRLVIPTKGKGIDGDKLPISEWKRRDGVRIGREWQISRSEKRAVPLCTFDKYYWSTICNDALLVPAGSRGALTFCTDPSVVDRSAIKPGMRMLTDQILAETGTREPAGRQVVVWELRDASADNHLWDSLVESMVGASTLGAARPGQQRRAKSKRRRRTAKYF